MTTRKYNVPFDNSNFSLDYMEDIVYGKFYDIVGNPDDTTLTILIDGVTFPVHFSQKLPLETFCALQVSFDSDLQHITLKFPQNFKFYEGLFVSDYWNSDTEWYELDGVYNDCITFIQHESSGEPYTAGIPFSSPISDEQVEDMNRAIQILIDGDKQRFILLFPSFNTADYLSDLANQKQNLVDTLNNVNVYAENSETLDTLIPKVDAVYEAGQKSEYDRFWDDFQGINGSRRGYTHAFAGQGWSDNTYNPKYPITLTMAGSNMFAWNIRITSTKVPLILDSTNTAGLFSYASALKEVPSIKVTERVSYANWFTDCKNLETINFTEDSVIANNINLSPCTKLEKDSILNIISVLKDFRQVKEYDIHFDAPPSEVLPENFSYGNYYPISEISYDNKNIVVDIGGENTYSFHFHDAIPEEFSNAKYIAFSGSGANVTLITFTATRTLTIGTTTNQNLKKLSEAEIAGIVGQAIQKGWTVA